MLRMIISVYKVMLLIGSLLALVTIIWGGLVALIEGATPFERGSGLGAIVFGTFSVIIIAGALAVALDNNALLRQIADRLEGQTHGEEAEDAPSPVKRSDSGYRRREPTI